MAGLLAVPLRDFPARRITKGQDEAARVGRGGKGHVDGHKIAPEALAEPRALLPAQLAPAAEGGLARGAAYRGRQQKGLLSLSLALSLARAPSPSDLASQVPAQGIVSDRFHYISAVFTECCIESFANRRVQLGPITTQPCARSLHAINGGILLLRRFHFKFTPAGQRTHSTEEVSVPCHPSYSQSLQTCPSGAGVTLLVESFDFVGAEETYAGVAMSLLLSRSFPVQI